LSFTNVYKNPALSHQKEKEKKNEELSLIGK
jgi:hypothetical protein